MHQDSRVGEPVRFIGSMQYCYGYVLGVVEWNPRGEGEGHEGPMIRCVVVRYAWNPDGDPPRRMFTIVKREHVEPAEVPEGYVVGEFLQ